MKRNRERVKADLMAEMSVIVDRYLDWEEKANKPDLREIEDVTLRMRDEMGRRMAEIVIANREAKQPPQTPVCPECGGRLVYRGQKKARAESRLGTLETERGHYYCAHCKRGIFPPG